MGKLGQEPDHFYIQENSWALCRGKSGQAHQTLQFWSVIQGSGEKTQPNKSHLFKALQSIDSRRRRRTRGRSWCTCEIWKRKRRHPHPAPSAFFEPSTPQCRQCLRCTKSSAECDPSLFPGGEERWRWKQCQKARQNRTQLSRLCKSKLGPEGVFFFFIIREAIFIHVLPAES